MTIGKHLVSWLISYWVLLHFFAYTDEVYLVDYIYTALFHISLLFVVYVNLMILIPWQLNKQHYLYFGIGSILLLIAGSWINTFIFTHVSDWLFPNYFFISYYSFQELLLFTGIYWVVSTLAVLSQGWFKLKATEKHLAQTEHEKIKAELAMLKAQINPHFLFNSLHNIYSMTLESDPRSSEVILLLSDVLRYNLYEAKGDQVLLQKELKCLEQYLNLQRIRMPEININYRVQGIRDEETIAPLLLLPLIENAFKHGDVSQDDFFVHVDIQREQKSLLVEVSNSTDNSATDSKPAPGGIGLKNLRRRLELLYSKKHQLDISEEPGLFKVNLNIDLHSYEN